MARGARASGRARRRRASGQTDTQPHAAYALYTAVDRRGVVWRRTGTCSSARSCAYLTPAKASARPRARGGTAGRGRKSQASSVLSGLRDREVRSLDRYGVPTPDAGCVRTANYGRRRPSCAQVLHACTDVARSVEKNKVVMQSEPLCVTHADDVCCEKGLLFVRASLNHTARVCDAVIGAQLKTVVESG